ncbi:hypothetical protein I552_1420 [Mycobacterium xenopi 3993]|nr:hypothetical protein I552_1420 [Mycobacterium xenopi 3993]
MPAGLSTVEAAAPGIPILTVGGMPASVLSAGPAPPRRADGLELTRRLGQSWTHGYCTVWDSAAGGCCHRRRRGNQEAAADHPDVPDDAGQPGSAHRDAVSAEPG